MFELSEAKVFKFSPFERKVLNWVSDGCAKPNEDGRQAIQAISVDENAIISSNGMMIKCAERKGVSEEMENQSARMQRIPANGMTITRPAERKPPDFYSFISSESRQGEPVVELCFDPALMINILKGLEKPVVLRIYQEGKCNQPVELYGLIEGKEGKIGRKSFTKFANVFAILMPMHNGRGDMRGGWKPSKPTQQEADEVQ